MNSSVSCIKNSNDMLNVIANGYDENNLLNISVIVSATFRVLRKCTDWDDVVFEEIEKITKDLIEGKEITIE